MISTTGAICAGKRAEWSFIISTSERTERYPTRMGLWFTSVGNVTERNAEFMGSMDI